MSLIGLGDIVSRVHIDIEKVEDPDDLRLKKHVLLAYTDVSAAGSRTLLGIDMGVQYFKLELPELSDHQPAVSRDKPAQVFETEFLPLQVFNCKYEEFSIVIINTILAGKECHYVANRVMDLCTQSNVESITMVTVLKLDIREKAQKAMSIYENCFFTEKKTKLPSLPETTMLSDPFFATFIQMINVERMPTHTFIIPGFRGYKGTANVDDGSKEAISLFQKTLTEITGLKFNNQLSNEMVYSGPADNKSDLASMMFG